MVFPSNRVRIMVATKPIDFRKGHDGLAALVKNDLHTDPFTLCPAGECGAFTERWARYLCSGRAGRIG